MNVTNKDIKLLGKFLPPESVLRIKLAKHFPIELDEWLMVNRARAFDGTIHSYIYDRGHFLHGPYPWVELLLVYLSDREHFNAYWGRGYRCLLIL